MPKISIIVPVYNAETTIRTCVMSILGQTCTDFELLLMDDGSTDGTAALLDEFACEDRRIHVIHKQNTGVSDTRNQALDLARGEYIQFVDADDWIDPLCSRQFVQALEEHPECDMVISDFYRVIGSRKSQKGDIEEERPITRMEYAQAMMRNPADYYYGVLWNKFYRRSLIERWKIRMDTNLSWAEDFIFNMEYILHTDYIYVIKAAPYYYVKTEGSLVSSQGASLTKTMQMKLNVVEYYSQFYKDIYKDGGYYLRTPAIYSFLLNFAHDGGVARSDQNREDQIANVSFDQAQETNPFAAGFYEKNLLRVLRERVMKGNELTKNDADILLYLRLAGGSAAMPQIRSYTGLSRRSVSSSLQKLIHRKLIAALKTPAETKGRRQTLYVFGEESEQMQETLDHALRDAEELETRGFNDEEMAAYRRLRVRVSENICSALTPLH